MNKTDNSSLKKILILAFYFPPNNFTASNRPFSWYKYLSAHGYYPVIITRNWNEQSNKSYVDKSEEGEIHYVAYKENLFTRLTNRFLKNDTYFFKKLFLAVYYTFQYLSSYFRNSNQIETYLDEYSKDNNELKCIIATGNPFWQFILGVRLKKLFTIPFIGDYRDPWSNNEDLYLNTFMKWTRRIDVLVERKLAQFFDAIIAVSEQQLDFIAKHIHFTSDKKYTLYNGYIGDYVETNYVKGDFMMLFSGMVYPNQPIEAFINSYINLYKKNLLPKNATFVFLGIAQNKLPFERISIAIKGYEHLFQLTERVDHKEAINFQKKATVFVMPSHTNRVGIPSSKLFDYVYLGKPILLYPNDKDVIEKILTETQLGLIANSQEELETNLLKCIKAFNENTNIVTRNNEAIINYSRKTQTQVLVKALKDLGI
jgi:glycosyltransferase involved in cell wall biosynthesis